MPTMAKKYQTYAEWLADNPPPDLQKLVEKYGQSEVEITRDGKTRRVRGGLSHVPEEAWREYQAQMEW
jgi:hypothetical protein